MFTLLLKTIAHSISELLSEDSHNANLKDAHNSFSNLKQHNHLTSLALPYPLFISQMTFSKG